MLPSELAGKYEERGTLGAGAMGTVVEAFDRMIERRVAVKLVKLPSGGDAEALEAHARFRREAQAAGRLSHPNIVGVYDYGENADTAWIVMEMVEGGTLKGIIDRGDRMPVPEIVRVMDQVLAALAYSHGRGVVHRDIKPANLMLAGDRTVKIADFGIARIENSSMTQVGTVMGTPSYMAPEQLRGEPVDARADIWAAGVVLYQLLTGEKPFEGNYTALMHRVLNTEPPPPSQLSVGAPRAMDAVVARALAKRPDDRFASAAAFAEAIRGAANGAAEATGGFGFGGAGPLPGLDDATMVANRAAPATRPAGPSPSGPASGPATTPPAKSGGSAPLIIGGGVAALVAAGAAAFFLMGRDPAPGPVASLPPATTQTSTATPEPRPAPPPEPAPVPPPPVAGPVPAAPPSAGTPGTPPAGLGVLAPPVTTPPVSAPAPTAPPVPNPPVASPTPQPPAPPVSVTPAPVEAAPARPAPPVQAAIPAPTPSPSAGPSPGPSPGPALGPAAAPPAKGPVIAALPTPPVATAPPPVTTPPPATQPVAAPVPPRIDFAAAAQAAATAAPCSLLSGSARGQALTVTGVLRRGGEAQIRRSLLERGVPLQSATLDVQPFEGPYCGALDVIRQVAASAGEAPSVGIIGAMPLQRGDLLRLDVQMPARASNLYVSYVMKSSEIVHLVPSQPHPAGAQVRLGEPRPGFPGWEVDEPYGTDLVVVFASDRPLFAQPRPVIEPLDDYLAALGAALREARMQGSNVAARAVVVETVARR